MFNLATLTWVWVAGQTTLNPTGSYPAAPAPKVGGEPPGRASMSSWSDWRGSTSKFYFYGGTSGSTVYSDLWSFDTVTSQFTWWGGTNGGGVSIVTVGTPHANNRPGAISQSNAAVDAYGGTWIFLGTDSGTLNLHHYLSTDGRRDSKRIGALLQPETGGTIFGGMTWMITYGLVLSMVRRTPWGPCPRHGVALAAQAVAPG
jgi:hypothetical protein